MATIQKRGNSYKITVSCGYDMNGKQIRKNTTYTPASGMTPKQIEKEVERQAVLFEEKCKTGRVLDSSIKFAVFAETWLVDYAEKQLKAKTVARYKDMIKRINPAIGHLSLDKIQPIHLMQLYDNLTEAGIKVDCTYKPIHNFKDILKEKKYTMTKLSELSGVSIGTVKKCSVGQNVAPRSAELISKALERDISVLFEKCNGDSKLSPKTILHHHRLISSILNTAVQWQLLYGNPCERVKTPKVERTEARYLDEVEAAEMFKCLQEEDVFHRAIITLLLYSGMRRGELCGLQWSDIDFDDKIIKIQRSSLYLPERGIYEDTTKNYSSDRVIKIADEAINLLKEYKMHQNSDRVKAGDRWIETGRVFTRWDGEPIHPDSITGWFSKFIKKNSLPNISIHSLRHTNATLLIASGVDLRTLSKRLGHAQLSTTGNIYTHAIKSADERAADIIQDIFKPTEQNKQAN